MYPGMNAQMPSYLQGANQSLPWLSGGQSAGNQGMSFADMLERVGFGGHHHQSPMSYLNQIPGTLKPYFQPYVSAGQQAMPNLMQQYHQLLQNPAGIMGQIGAGFQQSPGYQFQVDQALGAANRAAAAGGMLGTPAEQQGIASTVNQLANQDYYNYMDRALQQYGLGLQGLQGVGQLGFGAASGLGENLAQALMGQGNLAYADKLRRSQQKGGILGALVGGAGSALGGLFGGPAGAGIGGALGGLFGGGGRGTGPQSALASGASYIPSIAPWFS